MESQPQNPEFRINPENFHPCTSPLYDCEWCCVGKSLFFDSSPSHNFSIMSGWFRLICCFTSHVNSYGHGGTVS